MKVRDEETVDDRRFSFGQNWEEFFQRHFNEERVHIARQHIVDFLMLPDLKGKTFLDVGCGSGLSSLAAWDAGVSRLVSFDIDPRSVSTTERIRQHRGAPESWTVLNGSILDRRFLATLEPADIVYAWGVLHHTGEMWTAIRNAAGFVGPGGLFYIALYLTTPATPYWIRVKKQYNAAGRARKRWMEFCYIARRLLLARLVRLQNPFAFLRQYHKRRGMDYLTDVRDWLGGYPYEDASIGEIVRFAYQDLGLTLINIGTNASFGEFLFRKQGGGIR